MSDKHPIYLAALLDPLDTVVDSTKYINLIFVIPYDIGITLNQ